ncbi:MAG: FAD-binding protein [Acidiferrobacter sp.]
MTLKPEVLIVGGGPAGLSAALRLAHAGVPVLVLEAGEFAGAENWSGGVYHAEPLLRDDVLGAALWAQAPKERRIVSRALFVHDGTSGGGFAAHAVAGNDYGEAWTVLRPRLDRWLASRAIERGVTILPRTAATALRYRGGRVVGVDTDRGPIEAPVVFLAEGDAGFLLAREHRERAVVHYAQGIKAVFALPPAVLEARFGVGPGEGIAQEWVLANGRADGRLRRLNATGFVYTNAASLSVGLVVPLASLATHGGDHAALLTRFLQLEVIQALTAGARQVAYGVKVIRSGGFDEGAPCAVDGLAVGGALLGLGVEFPYPNFMGPAAASGVAFADAVIALRPRGDYTAAALTLAYGGRLQASVDYANAVCARAWPQALHATPLVFDHLPAMIGGLVSGGSRGRAVLRFLRDGLRDRGLWTVARRLRVAAVPSPAPPLAVQFLAVRGAQITPLEVSNAWAPLAAALGYVYGRGLPDFNARLAAIATLPLRRSLMTLGGHAIGAALRGGAAWVRDTAVGVVGGRRRWQRLRFPAYQAAAREARAWAPVRTSPLMWLAPLGRPRPDVAHIRAPLYVSAEDAKRLVRVCPAAVYRPGGVGGAASQYENCIKCESCRLIVPDLDWTRTSGHRLIYTLPDTARTGVDGSVTADLTLPAGVPVRPDPALQALARVIADGQPLGPVRRAAVATAIAALPPTALRGRLARALDAGGGALAALLPRARIALRPPAALTVDDVARRFPRARLQRLQDGWNADDRAAVVALLHRGCTPAAVITVLAEYDPGLAFVAAHHVLAEARLGPQPTLTALAYAEADGPSWWLPDTGGVVAGGLGGVVVAHATGLTCARPIRVRADALAPVVIDDTLAVVTSALWMGLGRTLRTRAGAYSAQRVQFAGAFIDRDGSDAIAKFGAVKHHLAAIEYSMALAVRLTTAGPFPPGPVIALLRARFGVSLEGVAWRAGQIFGGLAYSEDDILAARYRDAMVLVQWPGSLAASPLPEPPLWTMPLDDAALRLWARWSPLPLGITRLLTPRPVPPRWRRARPQAPIRYHSGQFLHGQLLAVTSVLLAEDFRADATLRTTRAAVLRLLRQGFRDPAGGPYGRYIDDHHGLPDTDIAALKAFKAFATLVAPPFGGRGFSKAQYAVLTSLLMGRADTSVGLLVMASTSIGTMPVLLALDKDLPRLERELATLDDAVWSRLDGLCEQLHRRLERPWPPALRRTLQAIGTLLQTTFLAPGSALKYLVGDLLPAAQALKTAAAAQDLEGMAAATTTLRVALNDSRAVMAEERGLLADRRLAHQQFLQFLACGQISAFALTEPTAGSDTGAITTRGVRQKRPLVADPAGFYHFVVDGAVHTLLDQRRLEFEAGRAFYRLADGRRGRLDDHAWGEGRGAGRRQVVVDDAVFPYDDIGCPQTTADGLVYDYYALSGAKMWITNGALADRFCLYAETEQGETGFMVERRADGLRVGPPERKLGQRASPTNELALSQVRVCVSHIIGYRGHGQVNALETLSVGRGGLVSGCVALLERMLSDYASLWAQAPAAYSVAVYEYERIRSLAARLIGLMDNADLNYGDFRIEAAASKVLASEGLHRVLAALEGLRGPPSVAIEEMIEKWRRDARVLNIYEGTNEIQRFLVLKDLPSLLSSPPSPSPTGCAPLDAALAGFRGFATTHLESLTAAARTDGTAQALGFALVDWLCELYTWCALYERRRTLEAVSPIDTTTLAAIEAEVADAVAARARAARAMFAEAPLYLDALRLLASQAQAPAAPVAAVGGSVTDSVVVLVRATLDVADGTPIAAGLDDGDLAVLDQVRAAAWPVTAWVLSPQPLPDLCQRLRAAGLPVRSLVSPGLVDAAALGAVLAEHAPTLVLTGPADPVWVAALSGALGQTFIADLRALTATRRGWWLTRASGRQPLAYGRGLVGCLTTFATGDSDDFTVGDWLAALRTPLAAIVHAGTPLSVLPPLPVSPAPEALADPEALAQWLTRAAPRPPRSPRLQGQGHYTPSPVLALVRRDADSTGATALAARCGAHNVLWLRAAGDAPPPVATATMIALTVSGNDTGLAAALAARLAEIPVLLLASADAPLAAALARVLSRPLVTGIVDIVDGAFVCTRRGLRLRQPRPPQVVGVAAPMVEAPLNAVACVALIDWGMLAADGRQPREARGAAGAGVTGAAIVIDIGWGALAVDRARVLEPLCAALARATGSTVAIGGTRKMVDEAHVLSVDQQIGQTGVQVAPRVLLAVGVSGAPQHLAGIDNATQVVAVNCDPQAPIFTAAVGRGPVIGCVGDARAWMEGLLMTLTGREGGPP